MIKSLQKLMLVEDEPDIREVSRLALETMGPFILHTCSGGQEALNTAPIFKPDLIILDMMMPGMDGLTTLKLLRANVELKNIPVIFMTAKAQKSEMKHYIEKGAIGAIPKPFDPMHLAEEIRQIWNNQT